RPSFGDTRTAWRPIRSGSRWHRSASGRSARSNASTAMARKASWPTCPTRGSGSRVWRERRGEGGGPHRRVARAPPEVQEWAARVSAGRERARLGLQEAILDELREIGMPGARFEVHIEPLPANGPDGAERVEFRFAGGERQPLLSFAKVASGG